MIQIPPLARLSQIYSSPLDCRRDVEERNLLITQHTAGRPRHLSHACIFDLLSLSLSLSLDNLDARQKKKEAHVHGHTLAKPKNAKWCARLTYHKPH